MLSASKDTISCKDVPIRVYKMKFLYFYPHFPEKTESWAIFGGTENVDSKKP